MFVPYHFNFFSPKNTSYLSDVIFTASHKRPAYIYSTDSSLDRGLGHLNKHSEKNVFQNNSPFVVKQTKNRDENFQFFGRGVTSSASVTILIIK